MTERERNQLILIELETRINDFDQYSPHAQYQIADVANVVEMLFASRVDDETRAAGLKLLLDAGITQVDPYILELTTRIFTEHTCMKYLSTPEAQVMVAESLFAAPSQAHCYLHIAVLREAFQHPPPELSSYLVSLAMRPADDLTPEFAEVKPAVEKLCANIQLLKSITQGKVGFGEYVVNSVLARLNPEPMRRDKAAYEELFEQLSRFGSFDLSAHENNLRNYVLMSSSIEKLIHGIQEKSYVELLQKGVTHNNREKLEWALRDDGFNVFNYLAGLSRDEFFRVMTDEAATAIFAGHWLEADNIHLVHDERLMFAFRGIAERFIANPFAKPRVLNLKKLAGTYFDDRYASIPALLVHEFFKAYGCDIPYPIERSPYDREVIGKATFAADVLVLSGGGDRVKRAVTPYLNDIATIYLDGVESCVQNLIPPALQASMDLMSRVSEIAVRCHLEQEIDEHNRVNGGLTQEEVNDLPIHRAYQHGRPRWNNLYGQALMFFVSDEDKVRIANSHPLYRQSAARIGWNLNPVPAPVEPARSKWRKDQTLDR
ncbi:hypothetical protein ACYPKM_01545 [Pseudomonas aeruginosa]